MIVGQPVDEFMAIATEFFRRHEASLEARADYGQACFIAWPDESQLTGRLPGRRGRLVSDGAMQAYLEGSIIL